MSQNRFHPKGQHYFFIFQLFSALFCKKSLLITIEVVENKYVVTIFIVEIGKVTPKRTVPFPFPSGKVPEGRMRSKRKSISFWFIKKNVYICTINSRWNFTLRQLLFCQFSAVEIRLIVLFILRSAKLILRPSSDHPPRILRLSSDFPPTFRRGTFDDPPWYLQCSFDIPSMFLRSYTILTPVSNQPFA